MKNALKGVPVAMKIHQRLIRKPVLSAGRASSSIDAASNNQDTSAGGASSGEGLSGKQQSAATRGRSGLTMLCLLALTLLLGLLPACSTPSTQRFAFAVRDGDTALPVPQAKATVTLLRQPFWFEGQPIYLTMDNVGMDHALLVLNQTAYKVRVTREGYADVCFDLPVLNRQFPFGKWLASIHCEHPSIEPCTDACLVSRLELMITEPMPE